MVGDRLVKGMWNDEAHRGVLGTVGKGYDGVLNAWWPAGVGGTLPRMVLADSVDSVDSVEVVAPVGNGLGVLAKAPSRVGDIVEMGSSLMGDTLRAPKPVLPVLAVTFLMRWRCCCCRIFSCRLRRRSISSSSGEASPCGTMSALFRPPAPSLPFSFSSSLMSVSVSVAEASSSSGRGPGERGSSAGEVLGTAALRGRRCSGGRGGALGGVLVEEAVTSVDEGGGWRSLVMFSVASPGLPLDGARERVSFQRARPGWC